MYRCKLYVYKSVQKIMVSKYLYSIGSIVTAEMTIRCKSLNTAKDPGGVKYYDTKIGMYLYIYTYM
jgi:hypothetical protein